MKTIILGYSNKDGKGPATLIAGPDMPISEQRKTISAIKASRQYPKGIARVEYCELVAREVGIAIEPTQPKKEKDHEIPKLTRKA